MVAIDEDSFICDMLETYHIFEYKSIPLKKLAILACGLRNDSRIKIKINQSKVSLEELFLAGIMDRLSVLVWQNTQDGHDNVNRPKSLVEQIINPVDIEKDEKAVMAFNSPDAFEKARKEIISRL